MFTGLVEELGQIKFLECHTNKICLQISAQHILKDMKNGDSIAVNGCCLTVVDCFPTYWTCEIVQETLRCTYFNTLQIGNYVNLERALRLQDRLGGHLMQGHVDSIGKIIEKTDLGDQSWWITINISPEIQDYLVLKGSIAVDGVSLTIADLKQDTFSIAIIPYTAQNTTLGQKQMGDYVNLETDLIAKYVKKHLRAFS